MKRFFVCLMVLALSITVLAGCNNSDIGKRKSKDLRESVTRNVRNKATSRTNKETTKNILQDDEYPQITTLVKGYLNAFLIKDSSKRRRELANYVDNVGDIDEKEIESKDYIESYSDIECYTKNGLKPNTYVVYACSQVKFKNIATLAPAINNLYVIHDKKNNKFFIHNDIKSDSGIAKYIEQVSKDTDVQELYKSVDNELKEACKSDKYLKDFMDKLKSNK